MRWRGRYEPRERSGDLAEPIDLAEDRIDVALQDVAEVWTLIEMGTAKMLDSQLDRGQRVFDLMSQTANQIAGGFLGGEHGLFPVDAQQAIERLTQREVTRCG